LDAARLNFRGEFFSTLKIIQDEHIAPERLVGSWAGAFGQTQFMPSTYLRLAVDFDGDGRRDLVDSVPDALASTANFLKRAGWNSALHWGLRGPPARRPGYLGCGPQEQAPDVVLGRTRRDARRRAALACGRHAGRPAAAGGPRRPPLSWSRAISTRSTPITRQKAMRWPIAHLSDRLRGGGPAGASLADR
jgi:membrane-bound lytic murein transglycosylase B